MNVRVAFICLAIGLLMVGCQAAAAPRGTSTVGLTVSAASDLTLAFGEISEAFEEETGVSVTFNFASSGQLAQQIERGAPVDLFAAADASYVEELEEQNLVVPGTRQVYGRGRLVLWTRTDSTLTLERLEDLTQPEITRVSIANPDHAPYGRAAREAMQTAGVWEAVQPKLVIGENVRQAMQYAETGNVDAAVVALSLAREGEGRYVLVPETMHRPLVQELAVVSGTAHQSEARAFAAFVVGPEGRSIMARYGFILPGEESSP